MSAPSGKAAVANGRKLHTGYSGMCQMYVRDPCWLVPSLYGSAIEAWNGARHKHPGDRNPPVGAPCYYRGGSYGHAVISVGGGRIRSTDCQSGNLIDEVDVGWPERSWGYAYLGWTEDLNGITLPLSSGGGGDNGGEDDMPEHVRATATIKLNGDWQLITWAKVRGDEDVGQDGDPGLRLGGRLWSGALLVHVKGSADGLIMTRSIEGHFQGDQWQIDETNPPIETRGSGADTYHGDARNQWCGDGHRVRYQIRGLKGATADADLHVLYW